MDFVLEKETLKTIEKRDLLEKSLRVNCNTDLKSSEVKILDVLAKPYILRNLITDGYLDWGGEVIFNIIYQDAEGKIKKAEWKTEFLGDKEENLATSFFAVATCVNCGVDKDGENIKVYADLKVSAHLNYERQTEFLVNADSLVLDKCDKTVIRSLGQRAVNNTFEEEFSFSFAIAEVLSQNISTCISKVSAGVGCVVVEGQLLFSALLLQKDNEWDIIKEEKVIPFRVELEFEEALPTMEAIAFAKEKAFKSAVLVDTENGNSQITISVNLEFLLEAYYNETISVVLDAYSLDSEIALEKGICQSVNPKGLKNYVNFISGRCDLVDLPVSIKLLSAVVNRVDVVSTTPISDGVSITGLLHANLYFIDGENYIVKKVEIPFNIDYNCGCESHTYKVFISPCKLNARLITISEAEISAEILSTVYCYSQDATSGVMAIEKTAERQENSHAISVYMGLDGEELFSLSKRLNVRPEDLVEINKDLQFPLTGKERIVIYRQR